MPTPDPNPQPVTTLRGSTARGLRRQLRIANLIFRPMHYMETSADRYGAVFKVGREGRPPLVYVGEPELLREVLALDETQVTSAGNNRMLEVMVGEQSILLLDGERHRRQRKLLMPPFHGDRLRTYAGWIGDRTRQISKDWQPGQTIVVRPAMQQLTLGIILQAVFGAAGNGDRAQQLELAMSQMLDTFASPLSSCQLFFQSLQQDWGEWSPWGRFLRTREQIRQLIYAEIRDRRHQLATDTNNNPTTQPTDILTLLLQARDDQGEGMSDVELHDQIVTLLLAGHETTTSAIAWLLYWLHTQPEVKHRLQAELAELGTDPDPLAVCQLPYLNAVCLETLRIYPITPTAFVRVLKQPLSLGQYHFAAGTGLMPAVYLIHRRPEIYPDPTTFRPDRFLDRQFAPHEFLPFGGGYRRCIGSALAMMELKLGITTLLQEFELAVTPDRPLQPVRRGLTLALPAHLRLHIRSRSPDRGMPFSLPT